MDLIKEYKELKPFRKYIKHNSLSLAIKDLYDTVFNTIGKGCVYYHYNPFYYLIKDTCEEDVKEFLDILEIESFYNETVFGIRLNGFLKIKNKSIRQFYESIISMNIALLWNYNNEIRFYESLGEISYISYDDANKTTIKRLYKGVLRDKDIFKECVESCEKLILGRIISNSLKSPKENMGFELNKLKLLENSYKTELLTFLVNFGFSKTDAIKFLLVNDIEINDLGLCRYKIFNVDFMICQLIKDIIFMIDKKELVVTNLYKKLYEINDKKLINYINNHKYDLITYISQFSDNICMEDLLYLYYDYNNIHYFSKEILYYI